MVQGPLSYCVSKYRDPTTRRSHMPDICLICMTMGVAIPLILIEIESTSQASSLYVSSKSEIQDQSQWSGLGCQPSTVVRVGLTTMPISTGRMVVLVSGICS